DAPAPVAVDEPPRAVPDGGGEGLGGLPANDAASAERRNDVVLQVASRRARGRRTTPAARLDSQDYDRRSRGRLRVVATPGDVVQGGHRDDAVGVSSSAGALRGAPRGRLAVELGRV